MKELSLHLLDIAENSVSAQARNITIEVVEDTRKDLLQLSVEDDGRGMEPAMIARITDPFVTSRTTRKVGLGIPLLKAAAEACNGHFSIQSQPGVGTRVQVTFQRSHIDRMPLGDLASTMLTLVIGSPEVHWVFRYIVDEEEFVFDDEPIKKELQDIPLCEPIILNYIRDFLTEGIQRIKPKNDSFILR
ncbi:MAG: sensor histidine kinase [Chloroflexi bacterium]|nr:ATP-binding protein [Anaerolineaceae bacterium]NMB87173.1 sensor histidine kinase [Chloroflexota bacterium]